MKIQFPAQISKVETTVDRGLRIKLNTPELPADEMSILFNLGEQQVYVAVAETNIDKIDVPEFVPEYKGEKSHSQRLKAVLHILWEQKTDRSKSSDQFYRDYMEKLIKAVKEKLD